MDSLDVRIIRSLLTNTSNYPLNPQVHHPQSRIARELHVSESTVRNRLSGSEISGFVRGWNVTINPTTIGCHVAHLHVDITRPSYKKEVIQKIKLVDGVWYIADLHGDQMGIGLLYKDYASLKNRVELISRIANAEHVSHSEILFSKSSHQFTSADLAIIKAAQGNPWQTYESISKKSSLSARTVRRRLTEMIGQGAFFLTPILDYRSLKGIFGGDLLVFYNDGEVARSAEQEVFKLVNDFLISAIRGRTHTYFPLLLQNLSMANEIASHVKDINGVREAYLDLVEEHIPLYHVFLEQIDELSQPQWQKHSKPRQRPQVKA